MDIFNKKRIKRMTETNDALHNQIQLLKVELRSTRENQEKLEQEIARYNRIMNDLIDENAKLTLWIHEILKITHVCETKNTLDVITIPIAKYEKDFRMDGSVEPFHQEDIVIPSIRFTTINGDKQREW